MTEKPQLIFNKNYYGDLANIYPAASGGGVAYFDGDASDDPGLIEARQLII